VKRVRYTSLASRDLTEAADFYNSKSTSAERRLLEDIERTAALLSSFPTLGEERHHGIRRFALHDFPYFLYYVILSDGLRIVAVAHQSREPTRWNVRLR
jgi:plasmid stabilization system protein ParE